MLTKSTLDLIKNPYRVERHSRQVVEDRSPACLHSVYITCLHSHSTEAILIFYRFLLFVIINQATKNQQTRHFLSITCFAVNIGYFKNKTTTAALVRPSTWKWSSG